MKGTILIIMIIASIIGYKNKTVLIQKKNEFLKEMKEFNIVFIDSVNGKQPVNLAAIPFSISEKKVTDYHLFDNKKVTFKKTLKKKSLKVKNPVKPVFKNHSKSKLTEGDVLYYKLKINDLAYTDIKLRSFKKENLLDMSINSFAPQYNYGKLLK